MSYAPPYGPPAENKSRGQLDYEHDVRMNPYHDDGRPRKTWDQLSNIERWSWELDRYRNGRP